MQKIILTLIISIITIIGPNTNASRRRGNARRSGSLSSRTYKTFTGRYNPSSNNFNYTSSNTITRNYPGTGDNMVCGIPAAINNNIAKKQCAITIANGLKTYCSLYQCTTKMKVITGFNFRLAGMDKIETTVNNEKCSGENLTKFCSNFEEEIIEGLWDLYSPKVIRERKLCNVARTKFHSAQECFRQIISFKNKNAMGADAFDNSKITKLDKEIEEKCGLEAIKKNYDAIGIDKLTENEISEYFTKNNMELSGTAVNKRKNLSSQIATLFANIGDNSWNWTGQIGKFADLKLDAKSTSYPRDIVMMANTFIADGEAACGQSFKTDMQNTSFILADNRSALEKEIERKGLLKGLFDYGIRNFYEPFAGSKKADDIKNKGMFHKDDPTDNINLKEEKEKLNNTLKMCPMDETSDKIQENINNFTTKIKEIVGDLDKKYKELEEINKKRFKEGVDNKEQEFNETLNKIITETKAYKKIKDENGIEKYQIINISETEIKNKIEKLKTIEIFTCTNIDDKKLNDIYGLNQEPPAPEPKPEPDKNIVFILENAVNYENDDDKFINGLINSLQTSANAVCSKKEIDESITYDINTKEPSNDTDTINKIKTYIENNMCKIDTPT